MCATYGYSLDYVRSLDGEDFLYLLESVPRVEAQRNLNMMYAVAAAFSGGEGYEEMQKDWQRIRDALPKIRAKQGLAQQMASMGFGSIR